MGSGCSCHIGSTNRKCKHVIVMLLVYMKQQGTKVGTRALPIIPSAGISDERVKQISSFMVVLTVL